jgi:hypothetical protein
MRLNPWTGLLWLATVGAHAINDYAHWLTGWHRTVLVVFSLAVLALTDGLVKREK